MSDLVCIYLSVAGDAKHRLAGVVKGGQVEEDGILDKI